MELKSNNLNFIDLKAFMEKNMPESYSIRKRPVYDLSSTNLSNYYIRRTLQEYNLTYR